MLAFAPLCALVLTHQIVAAPRLKAVLPNGMTLLVDSMPDARTMGLVLVAGNVWEEKDSNGHRHLLEHLMAKGPQRDLGESLESDGILLSAATTRETMRFEFRAGPKDLSRCLDACTALVTPLKTTPEELAREAQIIRHEFALVAPNDRLSAALWRQALADRGMPAMGTLAAIEAAKPDDLVRLQDIQFSPRNLVLAVAGPFDAETTMAALKERWTGYLPRVKWEQVAFPEFRAKRWSDSSEDGAAVGIPLISWRDKATLDRAVIGLGINSLSPTSKLELPFSAAATMAVLSEPSASALNGLLQKARERGIGDVVARGKRLLNSLVQSKMDQPRERALLRAMLQAGPQSVRVEDLLESINTVTEASAAEAFRVWTEVER